MKRGVSRCFGWLAAVLIPTLIATGCAGTATANLPATLPTVSPTNAALTAEKVIVKRLRGDETTNLQQNDSVEVQAKDRIAIEEQGRGLLRFPDRLTVELVRRGQLQVDEVRLEPAGFLFVRLKQKFGHTDTQLTSDARTRISLETEFATITAVADNTEFLVCHAPGDLTCMVATQGEAQVEAQNQVVTVKGGEGTYILPGQPPKAPICADLVAVREWLDKMRGTQDAVALGSLVKGWPEKPCSAASSVAAASPAAPLATAVAQPTAALPPATVEPTMTLPTVTAQPYPPLPSGEGMARIQRGLYTVGSSPPDEYHDVPHEINLSEFWIDQYEVTNARYKAFLDNTGHPAPPTWPGGTFPSGRDNHPVQGLTWDDAQAYCAWMNKRLPTEAEWEVAGRGPGAKPPLFPWGSDSTAGGKVNQLPATDTYEVGTAAFNRSPFGLYDMAGNVWQWVGEPYAPVPEGYKILRGGRHGFLQDLAYRQQAKPDDERFTRVAGVRCAADQVAGG